MPYTQEDVEQFILAMVGDALRLRTTPVIEMKEDDLYECVGLGPIIAKSSVVAQVGQDTFGCSVASSNGKSKNEVKWGWMRGNRACDE